MKNLLRILQALLFIATLSTCQVIVVKSEDTIPIQSLEIINMNSSLIQKHTMTVTPIKTIGIKEKEKIHLTKEEKLILATIIRLECGGSSFECQLAVGSVVLNRMAYFNQSLRDVIFAPNQFSTARLINKKTGKSNYPPSAQHIAAVEELVKNGSTLPIHIMYFRARHFHTWTEPYRRIDSTYFSYSKKYM